jgi:hypothetical protein
VPGAGQLVASHAVGPHPNVGSSIATHLLPHFFAPEPHVPMTHVPAWQASVAVPLAGQDELSQVVGPHPNVGSSIATHCPPQFLVPEGQAPMTHAPIWHARAPVPASGQTDSSQAVLAHPKVGSVIETHRPAHFFVPAPQSPRTQLPAWQTSAPLPASGQDELSHVVAPHPYLASSIATHWPPHRLNVAVHGASSTSALWFWEAFPSEAPTAAPSSRRALASDAWLVASSAPPSAPLTESLEPTSWSSFPRIALHPAPTSTQTISRAHGVRACIVLTPSNDLASAAGTATGDMRRHIYPYGALSHRVKRTPARR